MRLVILLPLAYGFANAQIGNVQVLGTTPTQGVLSYLAPDDQTCRVEVSTKGGFTPLVPDVDPAIFPGEDQDDRPGSIRTGRSRIFVIGKTRTERAASGAAYSRALQANADHYYRITCGASVASGQMRTQNLPLGSTHMDGLEPDSANPGGYLWPSRNMLLFPEVVDPKTGVLAKNINVAGWVYAGSSGAAGVSFADAVDPSGNWGTPANALAHDANSATYAGNSQDWLWLRLGYYPDNSTLTGNGLSFQNLVLEGMCTGTGCGQGGEVVEVCFTRLGIDPVKGAICEKPVRSVALTGTMAQMVICGSGAPCAQPGQPGDTMLFDPIPKSDTTVSNGYIYNTAADFTKIFFSNVNDCRRLFPNEVISLWSSSAATIYNLTITALDCAATPAQGTISSGVPLNFNGTTGVPFYYQSGLSGNPRYGLLLRKSSTSASSTISINSVQWVGASYATASFAYGSGGFNRVCSKRADANGFYHCHAGNSIVTGIRTEPDGTLTVRFLGVSYLFGQSVPGLQSGFQFYAAGASDYLWDDEDPNVIYFSAVPSSGTGGIVVVKATYTGNDIACGAPGSLCPAANVNGGDTQRWPQLPATFQVLTPCLNGCQSSNDDYSVHEQAARYTAGKPIPYSKTSFGACTLEAVQGKTLIIACRQGQQDTYAWLFAFDIGNGKPVGNGYAGQFGNTQQVFAALPIFARPHSRWCTLHTYQNIKTEGIATPEYQTEKTYPFSLTQTNTFAACSKSGSGNCATCPAISVNGVDYTGKNFCGTIDTSSTWNAGWGTAPAEWQSGELLSQLSNLHWLQPLSVGDTLTAAGEVVRVLQKLGPAQYVVERGVGQDQSYQYPRAHSSGEVWKSNCETAGGHWFYELNADGTDPSLFFATSYVNHAVGRDGIRIHPDYSASLAPFTPAQMADSAYDSSIDMPSLFGQKYSEAHGNTIEKHPGFSQEDAPAYDQRWFIDGHPYLFTGNAGSATYSAIKLPGDLYRYRYSGTIDSKHYDLAAYAGGNILRDVSGPGSTITGNSGDAYKVCRALAANECVLGSSAGDVYANVPALDFTQNFCKEGEFYSLWRDICVANFSPMGASLTQWSIPPFAGSRIKNFQGSRVLSRLWQSYRGSATTNAKPTPDGRWLMDRSNTIYQLPTFPATSSDVRATFMPVTVALHPPANLGVTNAIIEFGYSTQLYCAPRAEVCVANAATLNEVNPFVWPTEAGGTVTGLACGAGCQIVIPGISGKVLYYRWKYRNASNAVLATSALQVTVVP